jgi:hypothetical protein
LNEFKIFSTYEECRDFIISNAISNECQEKILSICQWLYSANPSSLGKIKSYSTREPGVRFFISAKGKDHFLCLKLSNRKTCPEMHFYELQAGEFIQNQTDNRSWKRIKGRDIEILDTNELKSFIRDAFFQRIGEALRE